MTQHEREAYGIQAVFDSWRLAQPALPSIFEALILRALAPAAPGDVAVFASRLQPIGGLTCERSEEPPNSTMACGASASTPAGS